MAIPKGNLGYRLRTDASDTGIGAELTQCQEGIDRLIACISRTLTPPERKWTVHEREALAIIWSLEKLKSYLVNSKFKICTDHRNLLWLLRLSCDKGRLARWGTIMSQWSIVALPNKEAEKATEHARCLVHEPGTVLASPDAFSRQNDINDGGTASSRRPEEDMALTISWPSQGGSQAGHGSRSKVGEDPLLPIGDIELDKARDEDPRDEDPKETAPALEATVEPTAAMAGEPAAGDQAAEATAPADLRTAMDTEPASSGTEYAEKEPASQEPSPSGASWSRIPTLSELKEAQKEDKYCLEVLSNPTMYSGDQAPYFIENDILYHRHVTDVGGMNMLVVPDCYRVSLMTMIHCVVGGHLGQAQDCEPSEENGILVEWHAQDGEVCCAQLPRLSICISPPEHYAGHRRFEVHLDAPAQMGNCVI